MLINYANYCETKPKRIFIKVKIWKDTCLLGEKKLFLAKNRLFLEADYVLSNILKHYWSSRQLQIVYMHKTMTMTIATTANKL